MALTVQGKGLFGVAALGVLVGLAFAAPRARADDTRAPADASASPANAAAPSAATPPATPRLSPKAVRGGIEASAPEFETLADGSTRLSIAFSQSVAYDAKIAPGRLVYVVKVARAAHRNDYNPLVTVDFNTPVASARLTPHGRDLWFIVDLRASVKPDVTTEAAKDGGVVLQIAFPKGDYVSSAPASPPVASSPSH
ncbi:MAG TPA: AMIN domain-containing protein [Polyangiaceae bacterium]|jgi:hypothetical protein|nr:AMIN domain-containing protein [Polyangiaceae bacterium]